MVQQRTHEFRYWYRSAVTGCINRNAVSLHEKDCGLVGWKTSLLAKALPRLTCVLFRVSSSAPDAAAAVRNFLQSLQGQGSQASVQQQAADKPYPYLNHLLPTSITVPLIDGASEDYMNSLLSFLPPSVLGLASGASVIDQTSEPSADAVEAAKASLSVEDKRSVLKKVLRSPQLNQALASLTMALRDGGLPSISDALGVQVANGGYFQGGGMPMGGGHAVEAFVEGVKKTVQDKKQ
jgi:26S proteasome regulatory subunit N13